MLTEENVTEVMIPLAHMVREMAEIARPEGKDDPLHVAVGSTLAAVREMIQARDLDDDERIAHLEALIMSLATWIYREKQTEFEQFVSESAELVVLGAMRKMLESANPSENEHE